MGGDHVHMLSDITYNLFIKEESGQLRTKKSTQSISVLEEDVDG